MQCFFTTILLVSVPVVNTFSQPAVTATKRLSSRRLPSKLPTTATTSTLRRQNILFETASSDETNKDGDDFLFSNISHVGIWAIHLPLIIIGMEPTLAWLSRISEPVMACSIFSLVKNAQEKQRLGLDTFKRLSGLLFLYEALTLGHQLLLPPRWKTSWISQTILAIYMMYHAGKAYFSGLHANGKKEFLPETKRLLKLASQTTLALPPKIGDFLSLLTVAILKGALIWNIFQVLFSTVTNAKSQVIAPLFSHLCELTLLGGSLVTSISIERENDSMAYGSAMLPLNVMITYVFGTMAAGTLVHALNPLHLVTGCIMALCSVSSASKAFRSWRFSKNQEA